MDKLQILSSVIGTIGGLLGLYTFIDNYLLPFKPKIRITNSGYAFFSISDKRSHNRSQLQSIVCKIDIFNNRNKLGRVDDFLFNIYNNSEINPQIYKIFPKHELENMPASVSEVAAIKRTPFTPLSIAQKSNKSVVLSFQTASEFDLVFVNPSDSLYIEVLYQNKDGNWKKVEEHQLKFDRNPPEHLFDTQGYCFSFWQNFIERDNISKLKASPKVTIYRGESDYYFGRWLKQPYWLFLRIKRKTLGVSFLIFFLLKSFFVCIYTEIFVTNLLRAKGKILRKTTVTFGNEKHRIKTNAAYQKILDILKTKIDQINTNATDKAKINLVNEKDGTLIERGGYRIKLYRSGDGNMVFQEIDELGRYHRRIFDLELKDYPLGICLWQMNRHVLPIRAICTNVLDYFTFHSSHLKY